MKQYHVEMAGGADQDLRNIILYIRNHYKEPRTAKKLYQAIKTEIASLSQMPERYPLYQDEPWYSQKLRKMQVKNFLVFYFVNHEQSIVQVVRVIYGGRDISKRLDETEFKDI